MILKMFTVYDSKIEAYLQPFYMQSTGAALRAFEDTCKDENSQFNQHPGDFTLFEVGTFDDQTCRIQTHDAKINLGCAIEHTNPLGFQLKEVGTDQ